MVMLHSDGVLCCLSTETCISFSSQPNLLHIVHKHPLLQATSPIVVASFREGIGSVLSLAAGAGDRRP